MKKTAKTTPSQERLKVQGTQLIAIRVISNPYVVYTWRGYAAVIDVATGTQKSKRFQLFIGPKTLASAIEERRLKNQGAFVGIKFRVRRESNDVRSAYVVE